MNADIDGKVTASVNRLLQEEPLDPQSFAPSKRRSIPRNVSKWFDEGSEYFSAGFAKTSVVSLHEFLNPNDCVNAAGAVDYDFKSRVTARSRSTLGSPMYVVLLAEFSREIGISFGRVKQLRRSIQNVAIGIRQPHN